MKTGKTVNRAESNCVASAPEKMALAHLGDFDGCRQRRLEIDRCHQKCKNCKFGGNDGDDDRAQLARGRMRILSYVLLHRDGPLCRRLNTGIAQRFRQSGTGAVFYILPVSAVPRGTSLWCAWSRHRRRQPSGQPSNACRRRQGKRGFWVRWDKTTKRLAKPASRYRPGMTGR